MSEPKIQAQLGDALIQAITDFARSDIGAVAQIQDQVFSHVAGSRLRRSLATTLYGSRWLYKLGLALVVDGDESLAHIRIQLIDYGAICEALLKDVLAVPIAFSLCVGTYWKHSKRQGTGSLLDWKRKDTLSKRTFEWLIDVVVDERIVAPEVGTRLHALRDARNSVHITKLANSDLVYARHEAKEGFALVLEISKLTKRWKSQHRPPKSHRSQASRPT